MPSKLPFLHYLKRSLSTATPMMIGQMIGAMYGFLGMLMLSHLGHNVLAATALLYSTYVMLFVILMSPLMSISVLVAHAFGQKNYEEIGNLVQQACLFSLLLSAMIMLGYWFVKPLLLAFGQNPQLIDIIVPYFHTSIYSIPPMLISMVFTQFIYGIQQQKIIIWIYGFSILLTIGLGDGLIYGHWGLPMLGVAGLGWATTISSWISLVLYLFIFIRKKFHIYHLFKPHMHDGWQHLKQVFHVGWPICLQTGSELLSFFMIAMMVGWLGERPLAAYQVVSQYAMLIIIPVFGLTQATSVLVGQALGAKNFHEVHSYVVANLLLALGYLTIVGIAFGFFPTQLASLYLDPHNPHNHTTLHIIRWLFLLIFTASVFDTLRDVLGGGLRGLFDTRWPMIISLIILWAIRIPLAYYIGISLQYGVLGIGNASILAMLIGAILIAWRWRKRLRLQIISAVKS